MHIRNHTASEGASPYGHRRKTCVCTAGWVGLECSIALEVLLPKLSGTAGKVFTDKGNDVVVLMSGGQSDWFENFMLNMNRSSPGLHKNVLLFVMDDPGRRRSSACQLCAIRPQ